MHNPGSLTIEMVGAGTVGGATGRALSDWGHDVVFKDPDDEVRQSLKQEGYRATAPDTAIDSDLSLVAVPTPYDEDSRTMRTHIVEDAVATLAEQEPSAVVIRSTVPPKTTERLAAEHNLEHYGMVPEFLFQDTARQDLEEMEEVIVGASTRKTRRVIKRAFTPQVSTFVEVTPTEAELTKMAGNTFAATKISFANEMWRLAEEVDGPEINLDADNVLAALRQVSPWFGPDMGMEGGWPYGGHCLPKDTRGLRTWAEDEQSVLLPQLSGTIAENDLTRTYDSQPESSSAMPEASND